MSRVFTTPSACGIYGIFNDSFPPILDGVTLTVENYAKWIQESGKPVCVVTPWNPVKVETGYDVIRYFSLPIYSRAPYRYGYPKCDPFIWKRLRNLDFKIAHAHCPFSSGRLALYAKKCNKTPVVGTFHSKYRDDLKHSFKHAPWCIPMIMKKIVGFFEACDEVWIPQAYVEETVREYGYKGKLTVVENGNDFASIIRGSVKDYKARAKKQAGIADDEISLLFVGQHIWEKGVDVIIDCLALLKGRIKFKMNFIGTGYAFDEIKERIKANGLDKYCTLHGVVSDRKELSKYYAAADLFLFPSFYDNAPLVVREAAAMGTPSLLVRDSTAAEVISDGFNGFEADKTAQAYADAIFRLGNDLDELHKIGLNARNTLVRSWEDVVGEVQDRYDVIIKTHTKV